MTIVIIAALIVLWAIIQKDIVETTGEAPMTRGSLRYRRRKARQFDIDSEDVSHHPRYRPTSGISFSRTTNLVLWFAAAALWIALLQPWRWF